MIYEVAGQQFLEQKCLKLLLKSHWSIWSLQKSY